MQWKSWNALNKSLIRHTLVFFLWNEKKRKNRSMQWKSWNALNKSLIRHALVFFSLEWKTWEKHSSTSKKTSLRWLEPWIEPEPAHGATRRQKKLFSPYRRVLGQYTFFFFKVHVSVDDQSPNPPKVAYFGLILEDKICFFCFQIDLCTIGSFSG